MSLDFVIEVEKEKRKRKEEGIILSAPDNWDDWLRALFPKYFDKPFAKRHVEFWHWVESIEKGKRPRPFVAIWGRGGAKCLHEDSEIAMSDGTRKKIKDIRVGETIMAYNEKTGEFTKDIVSRKWDSGIKDTIRIYTKSRRLLSLTKEHRVLTFNGWKKAGELTLTDRIASPRYVRIEPYVFDKSDEEVRFTSYILAEGGLSGKSSCRWSNADSVIIQDFYNCAESMGFSVKPSGKYGYYISGASQWVRDNGLSGSYSTDKKMPHWVFGLPERQKWIFLSAFVDTDGWIQSDHGRIGITLANKNLVMDLQDLFTQVGVVSKVYIKKNNHAGAWAVVVDPEYIQKCYDNMTLRLKGEKLRSSISVKRYSLLDVYPASIFQNLPRGMNRRIRKASGLKIGNSRYDVTRDKLRKMIALEDYEPWKALEEISVFWDQVVEIDDAGKANTYDIEVFGLHNMISCGLVTHNSTNGEAAVIRLAAKKARKYGWYISSTQDKADAHVDTIGTMLENSQTNKYYPELSNRLVNKYGNSKGWRRSRLRTASGFTVDALGLDTGARGAKVDEQRPDFIIIDDVDELFDTFKTTQKKINTITQSLLPAGSVDCAVLFVQNLIHSDSIASRLSDGRADFLMDRIVSGPYKAVDDLTVEQRDGKFIIVAGTATWEGQSLEICQSQIDTWGYSAFMKEAQHDVDKSGGIWDHIDFRHIEFQNLPLFRRTAVWCDPAISETDQSDSMGISAAGITRDEKIIGLYWWEGVTSPEDCLERAILKAVEIRSTHVGVETDQGGDTWKSVYLRSLDKVRKRLFRELSKDEYNRIFWPAFASVKAGGTDEKTGRAYGSKVERNFKMLTDYESGRVLHMIGTHSTIEKALWRFPKEPLDVADSWFWCWNDLRNKRVVRAS